jgi:hypothetical protein
MPYSSDLERIYCVSFTDVVEDFTILDCDTVSLGNNF